MFGVGYESASHANETAWISGKWLGRDGDTSPCVTILDTPGIGDTEGRDCQHATHIAQVAREMGGIHTFLLVVKGNDNRFPSPHLQKQLNLYEEIFGKTFWLTTVIEVNWWGHDKKAKRNRKKARMDEAKKTMQWNLELSKRFQITKEIGLKNRLLWTLLQFPSISVILYRNFGPFF